MSGRAKPLLVILGDEIAFPKGGASSTYVRRLGRAVQRAGADAVVLCMDYSERTWPPRNEAARGIHAGVSFEYLTDDPRMPNGAWNILRGRRHARRALGERLDAWARPGHAVALYYGRYPTVLRRLQRSCSARAIPLAVSLVEWRLAFTHRPFEERIGDAVFHRMLSRVDGAMVISHFIESELCDHRRVSYPVLRVPLLLDPDEWQNATVLRAERPYCVLCADFDAYPQDARFVMEAMAHVGGLDLYLVGKSQRRRGELLAHATRLGVSSRLILEDRFIPDDELRARYLGASALLAPLRDDDRSRARFPSKLADYLMAGRPVVSSAIGEVAAYLRDSESAFLASPGNVREFADAIRRATTRSDREDIAARGRAVALEHFDVAIQGRRIVEWMAVLTDDKARRQRRIYESSGSKNT